MVTEGTIDLLRLTVPLYTLSPFLSMSTHTDSFLSSQLSIFHYGFEGLIVNEVRYLSLIDKKYGLDIEVPGSAILSSFGFNVLALWSDAVGLGIFCGGFLVVGYVVLHFGLVERR